MKNSSYDDRQKNQDIIDAVSRRMTTKSDIDASVLPRVVSCDQKYQCAIFTILDKHLALQRTDGEEIIIDRNIVVHPHGAIILLHDISDDENGCTRDRYLVEREYRVGPGAYVFGLAAGLVEPNEQPLDAAFREAQEETGVVIDRSDQDAYSIDYCGDYYASEGMTDECASVFIIHAKKWVQGDVHFDPDEYIETAWVSWDELTALPIQNASSQLAVRYEEIRRLRNGLPA